MTAILPASNFYVPFVMDEQCLDDSFLTDGWENTTDELTFLCNNPAEPDAFPAKDIPFIGTKRSRENEEVSLQQDTCCNATTRDTVCSNTPNDPYNEGKFLIQVSFEKLRRVEDHECSLRRSVLINNTLKLVHREIYGIKSPFGLTSAMNMNMDAHIIGNMASPPTRKKQRRFLNAEANIDACSCRRKSSDADSVFIQQNCEKCTFQQVLNEDLDDDVFQNDSLQLEKEPSIFSELDSVFHGFVCALET